MRTSDVAGHFAVFGAGTKHKQHKRQYHWWTWSERGRLFQFNFNGKGGVKFEGYKPTYHNTVLLGSSKATEQSPKPAAQSPKHNHNTFLLGSASLGTKP
jgi:hypothetical protein